GCPYAGTSPLTNRPGGVTGSLPQSPAAPVFACQRLIPCDAGRGSSVSAMLAGEPRAMAERETAYERAMAGALALLESPRDLGGAADRESRGRR
ncbi:MAG: hypothetical protein NT090_14390, partial [Acidobacteria bacterium]|nr:hypothetical protein [Acidobacteriota bacterium]